MESKNELTINQAELLRACEAKGVSEIIKPLFSEVHLFDTYISGIRNPQELNGVSPGDRLSLRLTPSKFDDNEISFITDGGTKLGLVPEKDNLIFARLLDAGKMLAGKIENISLNGSFPRVTVGIYLVDF